MSSYNPFGDFGAHKWWRLEWSNVGISTFFLWGTEEGLGDPLTDTEAYTAFSNHISGGSVLAVMLDKNMGSGTSPNPSPGLMGVEFTVAQNVKSVSVSMDGTAGYPWKLAYSDDGSAYTTAVLKPLPLGEFGPTRYVVLPVVVGGVSVDMFHVEQYLRPAIAQVEIAVRDEYNKQVQWVGLGLNAQHTLNAPDRDSGDVASIDFYLSGGGANTDPDAALGGAISATLASFQNFTVPIADAGISVVRVAGAEISWGLVTYVKQAGGVYIEWLPSGIPSGTGQLVPYSGRVSVLAGGVSDEGHISLDLDIHTMAASGEFAVYVENNPGNLFNNVDATEAETGSVLYRGIYLKNNHPTRTFLTLQIWIKHDYRKTQATLRLGTQGTLGVIASESTAPPTGLSAPTEAAPLTIGHISAGQPVGIWIERTVPANSYKEANIDLAAIGFRGAFT